ncbi:hypothetical protein EVAR_18366_1 [Eumeta japonica]|uniref:Uncharacterized protein n=1 Tax=Eumeta variegata TaxID=151549 RepID=A0A4C1UV43_EUMVA|nr:hypothetical protein EVAR_18366_1 [Eumeta japonica]
MVSYRRTRMRNFLARISKIWNDPPSAVFPVDYDEVFFKKRAYFFLEGRQHADDTLRFRVSMGGSLVRGKRVCELPEYRRSSQPMDTYESKGVSSVLPASWEGLGYLKMKGWTERERWLMEAQGSLSHHTALTYTPTTLGPADLQPYAPAADDRRRRHNGCCLSPYKQIWARLKKKQGRKHINPAEPSSREFCSHLSCFWTRGTANDCCHRYNDNVPHRWLEVLSEAQDSIQFARGENRIRLVKLKKWARKKHIMATPGAIDARTRRSRAAPCPRPPANGGAAPPAPAPPAAPATPTARQQRRDRHTGGADRH